MVRVRNDQINLDVVAAQLESARSVGPSGASFSGLAFEDGAAVLQSAIEFSEQVSDSERVRIIADAIFKAGTGGQVTRKSLLAALARRESEYLAQPVSRFVLVTSVSIRYDEYLTPIRTKVATIKFAPFLPSRYDRSLLATIPGFPDEPDPWAYTSVRVSVAARSNFEAFDVAMEALDQIRGIWCFAATRGTLLRWPIGKPRPINPIRLGRCHTIHQPSGRPVGGSFWYPIHDDIREPIDLARQWPQITRDYTDIRGALRKSRYRTKLLEIFRRYACATDGVDFTSTFLGLWALLEVLTDTNVGARYNQTIDRVLFTDRDREMSRAVLEHLRSYRNASVHESYSAHQVEKYVFQLKRYVDNLLCLHLAWSGRFHSMSEVGEFLGLPHDPSVLKRRIGRLEEAVKFRAG